MSEFYSSWHFRFFWKQRKPKPRNKIAASWKFVRSIQEHVRLARPIQFQNPMGSALKYFRVNRMVKWTTSCNLCNGVLWTEILYDWIQFPSTVIFTTVKIFQFKKNLLKGKFVSRKRDYCINWNSLIRSCCKMKRIVIRLEQRTK